MTAIAALWMLGCTEPPPLIIDCNIDRNCENISGNREWRCVFDGDTGGYCARPDPSCPSGFRWDILARRNLASECVNPALVRVDGGT